MKKILFLILLCLKIKAQTLSGKVVDESDLPLYGASVYLEGTTYNTTCTIDGNFTLKVDSRINTPLVIRFLGYETKMIENPFSRDFHVIKLSPKINQLKEVIVHNQIFTRQQKLKAFKEQFLGLNKTGRSCKIKNEEDLDLFYDVNTNILTASSHKPLIVFNDLLKYEIEYDLHGFEVQFNKKSLKNVDARYCLYFGTTIYKDIKKEIEKEKVVKLRDKSYLGSRNHFFRCLVLNKWYKNNFLVFKKSFQVNPMTIFDVKKVESNQFLVELIDPQSKFKVNGQVNFFTQLSLLFDKNDKSMMQIKTNFINVDEFGNISEFDKVIFGGEIGKRRLGDLLPLDYLPKEL